MKPDPAMAEPVSLETIALDTGHEHFGRRVAAFDRWVDEHLEGLRGNRAVELVFTNASHLGDFSLVWHIINLSRGLTSKERERQAFTLSAVLAVESVLVNQGIKRLFRRVRPTPSGDERYTMRRPSSSSFPSGHATSAFVAASVLTAWDGKRMAPIWFGVAGIVGFSRTYVRIHHASDVVGGAVVGLALGAVASSVVKHIADHTA